AAGNGELAASSPADECSTDGDRNSVVTPAVVAIATLVFNPALRLRVAFSIGGPADDSVLAGGEVCSYDKRAPGVRPEIGAQEPGRFPVFAAVGRHFDFRKSARSAKGNAIDHVTATAPGFQRRCYPGFNVHLPHGWLVRRALLAPVADAVTGRLNLGVGLVFGEGNVFHVFDIVHSVIARYNHA